MTPNETHIQANLEGKMAYVFPKPGSALYKLIYDREFREKFHSRLGNTNRVVVPLYKLGIFTLFGAGKSLMLLTTTGRISRKQRSFPVGYFRIDGVIHLFSAWGKGANWYKNISANPDQVSLQVGLRSFKVRPDIVEDPGEKQRILEKLTIQNPQGAKSLMGWETGQDSLDKADFTALVEQVTIIRFFEVEAS